jgi:transposase
MRVEKGGSCDPTHRMKQKHQASAIRPKNIESVAWLGLDAHAKFSVLAWMDDQGKRRQHWRFPTSEPELIEHLQRVPAAAKHLALEECGLGRWLAQVAAPHVHDVVVCDPRENRSISRHHHKCDEEDSYSLAHLRRLGALKAVWQPTSDERAVFKCAVQAYLDAVERQTALKLQLKAHYRQWGVIPAGRLVFSPGSRDKYLREVRQTGVRAQLQLLYEVLDSAMKVERKALRLAVQQGRNFPEIARLRTVPGVGLIGALVFVAFIQEPGRFETRQQLWRYCRLGIRDRSSDGKPLGYAQLDRCGHGALKAVSYRAWLTAMKRQSGPVYQFYAASLERTGDKVHARLNTQRKVLHTLFVLWQKQREFDAKTFLGNEA